MVDPFWSIELTSLSSVSVLFTAGDLPIENRIIRILKTKFLNTEC